MAGKAAKMDPGLMGQIQGKLDPVTSLPSAYQTPTPYVASGTDLIRGANQMEKRLPGFMQLNDSNPLFSSNAAQNAQDQYYKMAIQPQMNQEAANQFLGGNLGDSNSTFGSTYLGSMAAQGSNQAFFAGQDYYNQQLQNMLNERGSFFGNDVNALQQQNQLGVSAQLGAAGLNQSALQGLNNFNLGSANTLAGIGQNQMQAQTQNNASRAQAWGGLLGGFGGLLGGGLGMMGGSSPAPFTGSSGGGGFSAPPIKFMGSSLGGGTY